MASNTPNRGGEVCESFVNDEAMRASGVSWGAILAGAAGAAALSLILLILGTGLGLSSISPWSQNGVSATTFGVSTILWISFAQFIASGLGGYLAGRLRSRWTAIHADEVYFRDTAHGFLAWAVATLVTAAVLTSAIGSVLGVGVKASGAAAGVAGSAVATAVSAGASGAAKDQTDSSGGIPGLGYFVDSLFRKDSAASATSGGAGAPDTGAASQTSTAEVSRVFLHSIRSDALPPEDLKYVAQVVAQRTGVSQQDAEKRVTDTYNRVHSALNAAETSAREAADKARKASAYAALWLFVSLLIGAFIASLAATYGGRRRDY